MTDKNQPLEGEELANTWASNAAQTIKEIEEEYRVTAARYEKNAIEWGFQTPVDSTELMEKYISKNTKILEAGCGTGLPDEYHYRAGFTNLYGCDLSQDMINVAKDKSIHISLKKVNLLERLPYKDDEFGAITCLATLTHIENPEPALMEFCRITEEDGVILLSHRNDLYAKWQFEKLTDSFVERGFWEKIYQSEWRPYLPKTPAYADKIKVGYFIYRVTAAVQL